MFGKVSIRLDLTDEAAQRFLSLRQSMGLERLTVQVSGTSILVDKLR